MPADLLAALTDAADDAGTTTNILAVRILAEELPDALAIVARRAFGDLPDPALTSQLSQVHAAELTP